MSATPRKEHAMKANRPPHVRARRTSTLRPRLETLERRWCPCQNNLLDDGTLLILGDDTAETIAIRDDGIERGVTVQCDRDEVEMFIGVRSIVLRSAGGDDRVSYVLIGNPDETPPDPATDPLWKSVHLDLGRGNDFLTIDWTDPSNGTRP